MLYNVLNFAGLSEDELSQASLLIGGDAACSLSVVWPSDGEPEFDTDTVDWTELDTVIVNWGEPLIQDMLRLVRRYALLPNGFHLGLVLDGMLLSCSFVALDEAENSRMSASVGWILPWDGAKALGRLSQRRPGAGPVFVAVDGQHVLWHQSIGLGDAE